MSKIILGDQSIFPKKEQIKFISFHDMYDLKRNDFFYVVQKIDDEANNVYQFRCCRIIKNDIDNLILTGIIYKPFKNDTTLDDTTAIELKKGNTIEVSYLNVIDARTKWQILALIKNAFLAELLFYPKLIYSKLFPKK